MTCTQTVDGEANQGTKASLSHFCRLLGSLFSKRKDGSVACAESVVIPAADETTSSKILSTATKTSVGYLNLVKIVLNGAESDRKVSFMNEDDSKEQVGEQSLKQRGFKYRTLL